MLLVILAVAIVMIVVLLRASKSACLPWHGSVLLSFPLVTKRLIRLQQDSRRSTHHHHHQDLIIGVFLEDQRRADHGQTVASASVPGVSTGHEHHRLHPECSGFISRRSTVAVEIGVLMAVMAPHRWRPALCRRLPRPITAAWATRFAESVRGAHRKPSMKLRGLLSKFKTPCRKHGWRPPLMPSPSFSLPNSHCHARKFAHKIACESQ